METGELTFIGFCSLAAINALFLAVYFTFRRERNVYAAALFSAFMLMIAFRIIQVLLHDLQDDFDLGLNLRSLFFFVPTFPLAGPLLYGYINTVSDKNFILKAKHSFHLLPFFLVLALGLTDRERYLQPADDQGLHLTYIIVSLVLIQFLIYIIISFIHVQKLLAKGREESFQKKNEDFILLRKIIIAISLLWLIYAIYCAQIFFKTYLAARVLESIYYSFTSYLILLVELRTHRISSLNNPSVRYKSSGLTADDTARYKSLILEYVKRKGLYKDHDITLGKFSRGLSLTPHLVSQVINEQLSCNFNDFINSYRIEEAKKMLKDPEMKNYTVASIAYDCGFNTLSAFNTSFKKFTGITPSQFRSKWAQENA